MKPTLALLTATLLLTACSVISPEVRQQINATPPFETLIGKVDTFRGQTTLVGGYILEVGNDAAGTRIMALQAPLSASDQPGAKDKSRGRLIITTGQFLDPEIYIKERRITVAGKILGSSQDEEGEARFPYLKLEAVEIYLWPEYEPYRYPDYRAYPYWYDPWYWGAPWYWHDPWYRNRHHWGLHGSWLYFPY